MQPFKRFQTGLAVSLLALIAPSAWAATDAQLFTYQAEGGATYFALSMTPSADQASERPSDVVILFDTLEHIEHTTPFLKAVFHHLRPGGVLLTNVPALMSLFGVYDTIAGHYRRYTAATLGREFAPFDVTVIDQVYWGFSMVPVVWVRKQRLRDDMSEDAVIRKGFVPPHPLVHGLLKTVMSLETGLLKRPPIGSSVMSVVRKNPGSR